MSAQYWDDEYFGFDDEPKDGQEFATQGGGIAVYQGGQYLWNTPPKDFAEMQRGDVVPEEWSVAPMNR